jgi:hypothetical protein
MIVVVLFIVAAAVVVLALLGTISLLLALPAIGIVIAVLIGFSMRRKGAAPPS